MLISSFAINQYVIKKNKDVPSQECSENIVHQGLECRRSIDESKGHDQKFVVAIIGAKGGLMDIVGLHSDLMISGLKIQLSEECRTMEFVKQLIDGWDWLSVLDSDTIECSIVHAKAPRTVFFFNQEYR